MINIMLIAGDKTEKLSEFLIQKGTFNLEYAFNSLSEDIHTIRDSIINVDKLVYHELCIYYLIELSNKEL